MDVMTLLLLYAAALVVVGSWNDIRTREVPDWLNFAAIAAALGTRLIAALASGDWSWLTIGLLGAGAAFLIASAMFYLGQWGGGDSKMLIALGALLGFEPRLESLGVTFFINALLAGAVYGVLWSCWKAVRHRTAFVTELRKLLLHAPTRYAIRAAGIVTLAVLIATFFVSAGQVPLVLLGLLPPAFLILMLLIRAVERCCMLKRVAPHQLTEGDWIVKDVVVGGKRITGPSDLGISKAQIAQLVAFEQRGKMHSVLIKEGMPFVPTFLFALLTTLVFGNVLLLLMA